MTGTIKILLLILGLSLALSACATETPSRRAASWSRWGCNDALPLLHEHGRAILGMDPGGQREDICLPGLRRMVGGFQRMDAGDRGHGEPPRL